jgi:uncharacterized protein YndB with AHSA1/START domain
MAQDYIAEISIDIDAPATAVWAALTDPAQVRQWMHGTNLASDWKVGSPITWSGEWKGEPYQDKGEVLEFEPEKRLSTTHWSPIGGSEDKPENYHTVTYELSGEGGRTQLTLKQSNNASQEEADRMAQNNWRPVIEGLKKVAEK